MMSLSNHMTTYFDIETGPLPDIELAAMEPTFEAPSNYKDAAKIAAAIEEKRLAWKASAALDATTGCVLVVGLLRDGFAPLEGDESCILREFWREADSTLDDMAGHNIFHFDLPFMVRRSWKLGVTVPAKLFERGRWDTRFVDTMTLWMMGNREARISLDSLARHLGVGRKSGSGAEFASRYAQDRASALAYLKTDLELTKACHERMRS